MADPARPVPMLLRLALILLAGLALVSAAQGCRTALGPDGSVDLGMTLKPASLLLNENPYTRDLVDGVSGDPSGETALHRPRPGEYPFVLMAIQLPSALMLLWPLTGLSWPAAKLVWLLANLGFTAGSLYLGFRRYLPGRPLWLYLGIASLLLASFPWRVVIGNGQHVMAALFFFLLATELADRGHRLWAGAALAASFVKYSVTLFLLPLLIAKRQWVPVIVALGIHGLMTLAIAASLGENPLLLIGQSLSAGSNALLNSGYVDLFSVADRLGLAQPFAVAGAGLLVVVALWLAVRIRPTEPLFFAFLCVLSVLVVYHRLYDMVLLLIPLIVVAGRPADRLLQALVYAAVLMVWLVTRLMYWLPSWIETLWPGGAAAYNMAVAALLYAALAVLFCRLFRPGPKAPAMRDGGPRLR